MILNRFILFPTILFTPPLFILLRPFSTFQKDLVPSLKHKI